MLYVICFGVDCSELEVLLQVLFPDVDPSEGLHGQVPRSQKEHAKHSHDTPHT